MIPLRLLGMFYALKPIIPRAIQISLRRTRARKILSTTKGRLINSTSETDFVWPEGFRCAAVLTHDVESELGQRYVHKLLPIEEQHNVLSCWNFVTNKYPVDLDLINQLRTDGYDIGVHGFNHDGRLFSSEIVFRERLREITRVADEWGASGFRSPSLLYDIEMLRSLPFSWDSSIPAWDPFQPQPGGCGIYTPFHLNDRCVELPVTLWQDFTLFEELQEPGIDIWKRQIDEIYEIGGLINVIVHPDYLTEERLGHYQSLIEYLKTLADVWFTLPSEVSEWVLQHSAR